MEEMEGEEKEMKEDEAEKRTARQDRAGNSRGRLEVTMYYSRRGGRWSLFDMHHDPLQVYFLDCSSGTDHIGYKCNICYDSSCCCCLLFVVYRRVPLVDVQSRLQHLQGSRAITWGSRTIATACDQKRRLGDSTLVIACSHLSLRL